MTGEKKSVFCVEFDQFLFNSLYFSLSIILYYTLEKKSFLFKLMSYSYKLHSCEKSSSSAGWRQHEK